MNTPLIETRADLLAHVLALVTETIERFELFADQMEVANNQEVAEIFQQLAALQRQCLQRAEAMAAGDQVARIAPWDSCWGPEHQAVVPEADDTHYLMTPYHALSLALDAERCVDGFFHDIAAASHSAELRALAEELNAECSKRLTHLRQWRAQFPQPEEDWDEDHDPPNLPE
jgi:hypothetical protein